MAGKRVLINSVILASPIDLMSHCSVSLGVLDDIERDCRSFLWSNPGEGQRNSMAEVGCMLLQHFGRRAWVQENAYMAWSVVGEAPQQGYA